MDLDPKDHLHKYLGPHSVVQPCRLDSVTGQVAQKSSHVKLCHLKPELSCPKSGVMSPEFYEVKCAKKES